MLLSKAREKLMRFSDTADGRDPDGHSTRLTTRWRTVVGVLGAISVVGAVCGVIAAPPGSNPWLTSRTSDEHLKNEEPSNKVWASNNVWRPQHRHHNARARAYAEETKAFQKVEADVGSTVAEVFAPYPDAEPWRDSKAGAHAQRAEVSATDEVWAQRFREAAKLLGVPQTEVDGAIPADANEKSFSKWANIKAWSFARYEPSWTGAYRTNGPPIGGAQINYYSIYKSANNNIRHSLDVMSDEEAEALSVEAGKAAAAAAKFAASLSGEHPSVSQFGRREDETANTGEMYRCKFTYLRDPLARFVSAYAEFEYRVSPEFVKNFPDECAQGDWITNTFDLMSSVDRDMIAGLSGENTMNLDELGTTFTFTESDSEWPPPPGTNARAKLLLRLLASLRWVDTDSQVWKTLNPDNDPNPVKGEYNCLVAFHHFFPQSNNFVATSPSSVSPTSKKQQVPLNFVGKLERFDDDWSQLANTCRVQTAEALKYDPLPNGGGHKETSGSIFEDAMRNLLQSDDDAMVSFCLLFLDDFTWGGYELPEACAKSEAVQKLTTEYEKGPVTEAEVTAEEGESEAVTQSLSGVLHAQQEEEEEEEEDSEEFHI